jgi:pimeloyl-ACP methyl ester carboxylesterase
LEKAALEAFGRGVLIVSGERDTIAAPPALEALADALPGAKLRVIPDADHFYMTGLADIARAVEQWL